MSKDRRTVVITGGNTGIGKEICLQYGAKKFNVVINWIFNEEAALEVVQHVENLGGQAIAVYGDVTSLDDCNNIIKQASEKFGKVDVDSEQELAERFEVMSIPTLILVKEGEIVDRTTGAISKEDIVSKCAAVWIAYLEELYGLLQGNLKRNEYAETKDLKLAMRVAHRIETIVEGLKNDRDNWIWQVSPEKTFVSFKCVEIKDFAEELLLNIGRRRIFMSATIGNPKMFAEELGLKPEKTAFVRVAYSSFPLKNRPIYTRETGGLLTRKGQSEADWNKTAQQILEIMDKYPNQRGIILPYTDRIERELSQRMGELNRKQMQRVIQHDKSAHGRDSAIDEWRTSRGGVIMSTYLNQGFDGKEADFCIVVKLPYLSLGDVRTAKKMKANPEWYVQQTGIELAQMCGRAVRSRTDRGDTYILDPSFWFQYEKGVGRPLKNYLPNHLCESIEKHEGKTPLGKQQKFEVV